jgi:hypothetical protein
MLLGTIVPGVTAQVEVTVQSGVHALRLDRPEPSVTRPGITLEGAPGEATTFSFRVGGEIGGRWSVEGGLAWSRNRSVSRSADASAPHFERHTIFSSATVRTHLTRAGARLGFFAGAGPAIIFHRGRGTSPLSRQTDLGAVLTLTGALTLSGPLAFRMDAHQYVFSSAFTDAHSPPVIGAAIQPAGARFRSERVVLAGLSWQGL